MRIIVTVLVALMLAGASLSADDVHVMSAGAVEPGLVRAAAAFESATGHRVIIRFGTGPQLSARLQANEDADVLIAPAGVMTTAAGLGRIDQATRAAVGRVGVGIVLRASADPVDVDTPEALRAALLEAATVVFNRASTGQYIERLIERLGVAAEVQGKAVRTDTGEAVMERIASGAGREIGFGAITEIRMLASMGIRLAGPLPAAVQNFTTYDVAALTASRAPAAGAALIAYLRGDEGQRELQAGGVEPAR
ncbi:MAG: substrate-binding domain-containing protein [Acidobacteria bacterium]|nr:substrate-binding domain-containing protein [Acidobacteriota bacterium]